MLMLKHLHPSLLDALFYTKHGCFNDPLARFMLGLLKWNRPSAGYEISNLGRLDIPCNYGKYRLKAVYGPVIYLPRIEKFMGITTLQKTMTMTCTFNPLCIDKAVIEKIMARVIATMARNSAEPS